jgi:intracellular septation protein
VVVIVATLAQILWLKARKLTVKPTLWISFGLVAVLGGLTIWLHDENFIKWKPTVLYWVFSAALALSPWVLGKNLVKRLMGEQMNLPDPIWSRLNGVWAVFFAAMGLLNLWVAYHFETATWVNFKLFGATGLLVVFMLAQGFYLNKHLIPEPDLPPGTPHAPEAEQT